METSRENSYEKDDRHYGTCLHIVLHVKIYSTFFSVHFHFEIGYCDQNIIDGDVTNSYTQQNWQTETNLSMNVSRQYLEGDRSPNRDRDEPLSYNSRPFNMSSSTKGIVDNPYSDMNYSGVRKSYLERQESSVLYDDHMGYSRGDYLSLYPLRNAQQSSQLGNKFDSDYGLGRQWNSNSQTSQTSQTMTIGKQLPKLPTKSYGIDDMNMSTTSYLPKSIPIASGSAKRSRQLPQPIGANRKRYTRNGQTRMLPQMPTSTKEDFERRGAISAMRYEDYSLSSKYYDDSQKSMNETFSMTFPYGNQSQSNDSLNTTAHSVLSEYSGLDRRNNKIADISSAIPIASSTSILSTNQRLADLYSIDSTIENTSNYYANDKCSDSMMTSRKRLPQIPKIPQMPQMPRMPVASSVLISQINDTSSPSFSEPTRPTAAKRLPIINAVSKSDCESLQFYVNCQLIIIIFLLI